MGLSVPQKNLDGLFVPHLYISSWVNHYSMFFSCLTQKKIYFLRMGGWPSLKTERRRQKWTSDMESGIIYYFLWCSCLCHKRIWMYYLFQIHIFHPGSPTIQCFLVVSHKKVYIFSGWAVGLAKNGTSETEMDFRYGVRYHLLLLVV